MRRWLVALATASLLTGCSLPFGIQGTPALPPMPPWPAPSDFEARLAAAGLTPVGEHDVIQQLLVMHLDVYYVGEPVVVPANIGIASDPSYYSPIHTHAGDGLISVDSPFLGNYTLGEFFALWNVPLVGALVYANGTRVDDPANLVFQQHQEIVVMYGKPPAQIPGDYSGKWPF